MKKLLAMSLFILNTHAQFFGGSGPIGPQIDLDHDPRYRASRQAIREEVKECNIIRKGINYSLNSKDNDLETVYELISTTDQGAELVNKISSLVESGELIIRNLTYYERQRRGLSNKVAALYDFTTQIPTILVNFNDELGLLVHFFVHEAHHALDERIELEYEVDMVYYNAFKEMQRLFGLDKEPMKPLSDYESTQMTNIYEHKEKIRHQHIYRAEREAFDTQGQFTQEILNNDDCYTEYIEEHRKLNKLKLFSSAPDSFIYSSYGINPSYLE